MRKYNLRLGFDQLDRRMNIGCIAARSCGEERGGGVGGGLRNSGVAEESVSRDRWAGGASVNTVPNE